MTDPISIARIFLWGTLVGYSTWYEASGYGAFEYDPDFLKAPVEPAPLKMPKKTGPYSFRNLNPQTYMGLPGMLADALPDKFGNALIDVWLARQGRRPNSFNPIERLCYIGSRGMGALEFKPSRYQGRRKDVSIDISSMVELASQILTNREQLQGNISQSLTNLLVVGTSAGGARAKCIIAHNEKTGEVRSGQIETSEDFTYWIIKLDGVSNNRDKELEDPKGYGRIEYAYHLMAKDCGIEMMPCKLLEEGGRAHFMTQRFDRVAGGKKLHMQSLCALAHFDFNMAGGYSYEQALNVTRDVVQENVLATLEQQFKRSVFNIIGRNQDDHTKNTAYLMDKEGNWTLSPAFDVTYSYNPQGTWTSQHQMSLNGKRDNFIQDDLLAFARAADLKQSKAKEIIKQIASVISNWPKYAKKADVFKTHASQIKDHLRIQI